MNKPITNGVHHIGLTVSSLEGSATFFTSTLGWKEINRNDDYPAIFVTDGSVMVTLWKNKEEPATSFDKNRNIGLHHVAFAVEDEAGLSKIHEKMLQHNIEIEFAPEQVGPGPARHMICYEPSGNRIEFIWPGT